MIQSKTQRIWFIAKLTSHQLSPNETLNSITLKLDELIHKLAKPESPTHSPSFFSTNSPHVSPSPSHCMKLEVLCFDGANPLGWIFNITQIFEYHLTPEHKRLTIASFYIEGQVLTWFQWMTNNGQLTSWHVFL